MTRRVVISGMGTVNPLAKDVPHYWQGLLEGRSGIGPILQMDTTAFRVHFGGEVKEWKPEAYFDSKSARRMDRYAQFALAASIEAIRDSGLDFSKEDPFRCGCILGSGIGGLNEFEDQHDRFREGGPSRISPFVIPKMMGNAAPGNVSIHFGLCGPCTAVATACASAANAVADAMRCIQRDEADVMVTGGCESTITNMGLGGFTSARALSTRNDAPEKACRPWDKDRDGFVLAEGAGVVVIEEYEHARKRGAPIFAELLGARLHGRRLQHHRPASRGDRRRPGRHQRPPRRPHPRRRHRLRQRPRHRHRPGRRRRDAGPQEGVRPACPEARHLQHQEHVRPPPRRLRRHRADRVGAVDQARRRPSDDQPRRMPTPNATSTTCRRRRGR